MMKKNVPFPNHRKDIRLVLQQGSGGRHKGWEAELRRVIPLADRHQARGIQWTIHDIQILLRQMQRR